MRLPNLLRRGARSVGIPPGQRVYAIGDIHGRMDLFKDLLSLIEADSADRARAKTTLILLGDFIDRGPDSARLMKIGLHYQASRRFVVLRGNHEAALIDAIAGDFDAMDLWLAHGGDATLRSFGVRDEQIDPDDTAETIRLARRTIPGPLINWLARLPLTYRVGAYFFVHAGVRPGVPLHKQTETDLLWIRNEFTDCGDDHGAIIVHGHSVYEDGVHFQPNRIGIDTGAWRTGRLSALGLEGEDCWALCT